MKLRQFWCENYGKLGQTYPPKLGQLGQSWQNCNEQTEDYMTKTESNIQCLAFILQLRTNEKTCYNLVL